MRKFEISRASPALLSRHSSPPLPSLSLFLSLNSLLLKKKYNNAGSHKRLIRISSSPHSLLLPFPLFFTLQEIIKAPSIRHSLLLLSFFVCLFVSSLSLHNTTDRAKDFRGQPAITHPSPRRRRRRHCDARSIGDLSIDRKFNSTEHYICHKNIGVVLINIHRQSKLSALEIWVITLDRQLADVI